MNQRSLRTLLVLFLLLSAPAGAEPERPRIGLALGGGGARGLAHIGVLKWLEEHHVPVDFVAGTSIGGLAGALYATGRSVEEMEQFVSSIDWNLRLAPDLRYRALAFRRKEDRREFPSQLDLGFKEGLLHLPPSLNNGHEVGLLLDRIAFPYSRIQSFDELPTPFRCVATDLVSGRAVVFDQGSLSQALRATMAIPGVFPPVRSEGRVLVDGGLLNNLPVDVARQMGADIVIAVNLSTGNPSAGELTSLADFLSRSIDVVIQQNVRRQERQADVVIRPQVQELGMLEFGEVEAPFQKGYEAAAGKSQELEAYALTPEEWEKFRRSRDLRRRTPRIEFSGVRVEGAAPEDVDWVQRSLRGLQNGFLDVETVEEELTRLAGGGRYLSAGYAESPGNPEDLLINLDQKPHGPPFLRPLVGVNGWRLGDVNFTIGGRLTFYDVAGVDSEWRTDLAFGNRTLAATEFFQPLGAKGFFVAPRAFADREIQFLIEDADRVAEFNVTRLGGGLDLGYLLGRNGELRFGYEYGWEKGSIGIGDPRLPDVSGPASAVRSLLFLDYTDSATLPTEGFRLDFRNNWRLQSAGSLSKFAQTEADMFLGRKLRGRWSGFLQLRGGTSYQDQTPQPNKFTLGGPRALGALGLGELRGSHLVYVSAGALRLLSETPTGFLTRLHAGFWYETGDAFDHRLNLFHNASAGLAGETKIGILLLGVSAGEGGRSRAYFSLGRIF